MLCHVTAYTQPRKNLESLLIDIVKPYLNEEANFGLLVLYCNGILIIILIYYFKSL